MKNVFEYKGYIGSAEVDAESLVLVGKLLYIQDVITYSAEDAKGLEAAFKEAVDEYLSTCEELNEAPDTPCKGTFNVRVGPELHRRVALAARLKGVGLNEFVCEALTASTAESLWTVHHHHEHTVTVLDQTKRVAIAGRAASWDFTSATRSQAH